MSLEFQLPVRIDRDMADELVKESAYIARQISAFRVADDLQTVVVEIAETANPEEISGKVSRYLSAMLRGYPPPATRVCAAYQRTDAGPLADGVFDELKRRQWAFEIGVGHVGFAGPALTLYEYIDQYLGERYQELFGTRTISFPALITPGNLARCGYFDSHPNNATWVTHLVEDVDTIEQFRAANTDIRAPRLPKPEELETPAACLNPAACDPLYYVLENQTMPSEGVAYSWLGRVFRYESRNTRDLERLWEFNVRELVFAGSAAYVQRQREKAVQFMGELAQHFDLDMSLEVASDPFFATVAAVKRMWQLSMETKVEVKVPIGTDGDGRLRRIAAGSINLHGKFFGERFSIHAHGGASADTACVGLGIERLMLATFAQHGFEPERWPKPVRTHLFLSER
jgi:seryl-tRNA synthetase